MAFKEKFFPALKRAAWTAIEFGLGTAIVAIPVGAAFDEVDWARLVSIALVATLISLLKSILLSMPEVNQETEIAYLREEIQRLMGFHDGKDVVDIAADPDEVTTILLLSLPDHIVWHHSQDCRAGLFRAILLLYSLPLDHVC